MPGAALIGALVLAVIAGSDQLLALIALRHVARRIASVTQARSVPRLRTRIVPFLPRVLAGAYGAMEINVPEFSAGGADFRDLTARLTQVRAPLRHLLAGDGLVAGQMVVTATIPFASLGERLPRGLQVVSRSNELRVVGTVLRMPVSGTLSIQADGQKITVTPRVIGVPSLIGFIIGVPAMSAELAITRVVVTDAGLEVTIGGTDVRLGGGPRSAPPATFPR